MGDRTPGGRSEEAAPEAAPQSARPNRSMCRLLALGTETVGGRGRAGRGVLIWRKKGCRLRDT